MSNPKELQLQLNRDSPVYELVRHDGSFEVLLKLRAPTFADCTLTRGHNGGVQFRIKFAEAEGAELGLDLDLTREQAETWFAQMSELVAQPRSEIEVGNDYVKLVVTANKNRGLTLAEAEDILMRARAMGAVGDEVVRRPRDDTWAVQVASADILPRPAVPMIREYVAKRMAIVAALVSILVTAIIMIIILG